MQVKKLQDFPIFSRWCPFLPFVPVLSLVTACFCALASSATQSITILGADTNGGTDINGERRKTLKVFQFRITGSLGMELPAKAERFGRSGRPDPSNPNQPNVLGSLGAGQPRQPERL